VNMTRWCLSCLFFKKLRKVLKTRAMQDLPIPSWHKFLELVMHRAGNSSVFAGHITKCENLQGECTHRTDVLLSETSCIAFFLPVFPSYSTGRAVRYHKTNWKYKISCRWAWHWLSPWKQGFPTHASLRSTSGVLHSFLECYVTLQQIPREIVTICRYGRTSLWSSTYSMTQKGLPNWYTCWSQALRLWSLCFSVPLKDRSSVFQGCSLPSTLKRKL